MKIHFIAIGGSAMHNMAIALKDDGHHVTGSDDQIFEPSRSRLRAKGLLPEAEGWFPERLDASIDVVVLGMHARADNPELARAQELGLKVHSYPSFIYEQTRGKTRVVIAGSHGKTTTTAMAMHALARAGRDFDYMVGAKLDGFETMYRVSPAAPVVILEGDEYLSSPIDPSPKFLWYKPQLAVITGIAWDHANVFPTFEQYKLQFRLLAESMPEGARLLYFEGDEHLRALAASLGRGQGYWEFPHMARDGQTFALGPGGPVPLRVFGRHNLQNMNAAWLICQELGLDLEAFLEAMASFGGAARRLQTLAQGPRATVFLDFAHSPSKLRATTEAVKEQFPQRRLVACFELHTFSSLKADFLPQYAHAMDSADRAFVLYDPEVLRHKRLPELSPDQVREAFGTPGLRVFTRADELEAELRQQDWTEANLLLMSSGNFAGADLQRLASDIAEG